MEWLVIAALVAGGQLWRMRLRHNMKERLRIGLEPEGSMTPRNDLEVAIDQNSPLRSTKDSQDYEGHFEQRRFLARLSFVYLDNRSELPEVGLWLQTQVPVEPQRRASVAWDETSAPRTEGDLAAALLTSPNVYPGAPDGLLLIRNGWLGYYASVTPDRQRDKELFRYVDQLAERVEFAKGDANAMLINNFYDHNTAANRARALTTLDQRRSTNPSDSDDVQWQQLLRDAALDPATEVRIAVASATGDTETLRGFVLDPFLSKENQQVSLRMLLRMLPAEQKETTLRATLASAAAHLCAEALSELGENGPGSALQSLEPERLITEVEVAEALTAAMTKRSFPEAMPHLKTIAERQGARTLRDAAVVLVGQIGNVSDVAWLRSLKLDTHDIETAIAAIQSRTGGRQGDLSVVTPRTDAVGSLSAVSEATAEATQLPED